MKKDLYQQFVNDLRYNRPQIEGEERFKQGVLRKLERRATSPRIWPGFVRVAASLLLLISVAAYSGMEFYTWEKRLYVEQNTSLLPDFKEEASWACRQSVRELLIRMVNTPSLMLNAEVVISKARVQQLQAENQELFYLVGDLIQYMEQYSPADYAAFQSGQLVCITSWKLRREYGICNRSH